MYNLSVKLSLFCNRKISISRHDNISQWSDFLMDEFDFLVESIGLSRDVVWCSLSTAGVVVLLGAALVVVSIVSTVIAPVVVVEAVKFCMLHRSVLQ